MIWYIENNVLFRISSLIVELAVTFLIGCQFSCGFDYILETCVALFHFWLWHLNVSGGIEVENNVMNKGKNYVTWVFLFLWVYNKLVVRMKTQASLSTVASSSCWVCCKYCVSLA